MLVVRAARIEIYNMANSDCMDCVSCYCVNSIAYRFYCVSIASMFAMDPIAAAASDLRTNYAEFVLSTQRSMDAAEDSENEDNDELFAEAESLGLTLYTSYTDASDAILAELAEVWPDIVDNLKFLIDYTNGLQDSVPDDGQDVNGKIMMLAYRILMQNLAEDSEAVEVTDSESSQSSAVGSE